jgi:hypothetical protein
MPTLLPAGDESAMNLEGLGFLLRYIYCFSQHFCELGVNFAENEASRSIAPGQAASGLWAWLVGEPYYVPEVLSAQKRGGQSTLTVVDSAYANFLELRQGEVRRIPLLRRWVNEESPKLRMASWGGRRGLLRAQTPCAATWRARQRPTEPEGAPRGPPAPGRAAGRQQSPSPAQPRCRRGTWGPRCRV